MAVHELETATRLGVRLIVVVFDDEALSLIKLKQIRIKQPANGVDFGPTDYVALAKAYGITGYSVTSEESFRTALQEALQSEHPTLISVKVDAAEYRTLL